MSAGRIVRCRPTTPLALAKCLVGQNFWPPAHNLEWARKALRYFIGEELRYQIVERKSSPRE